MTLNRINHRIRLKFPDGTDREAIYEFYRNNVDSLLTDVGYGIGLDHRVYNLNGDYVKNIDANRVFFESYRNHGIPISHLIAICSDGKTVNVDSSYRSYDWEDISYIACGTYHTVGLRSDGTVVAVSRDRTARKIEEACNVQRWSNIVQISCGDQHTVGLRADGTVTADGDDDCCRTQNWDDIVSIICGSSHTFGLRSDGRVLVSGNKWVFDVNLQDWKNITSIAFGGDYIVGLCADGTVVAKGNNKCGQCNVKDWRDIIAISCGGGYIGDYTFGLRADGTVMATGVFDRKDFHDGFRDIVAIKGTSSGVMGIRKDGYVMSAGWGVVETPHLFGRYYSKEPAVEVSTSSQKLF